MIKLTGNILQAEAKLLRKLQRKDYSSIEEVCFVSIDHISTEELFILARKCKWVDVKSENNHPYLTEQGLKILRAFDVSRNLSCRIMLSSYIENAIPSWRGRIPYGREETRLFLTKDEVACFYEAGLFNDNPTDEEIKWWDEMANEIRALSDKKRTESGRRGEKLTIEYEKRRTGIKPKWMSIETNRCGYDILSQLSSDDPTNLMIEVKATADDISHAFFHLSKAEWDTAGNNDNYVFYLWSLGESSFPELAILKNCEIYPHIPINQSSGEWESVVIPFDIFRQKFMIIKD